MLLIYLPSLLPQNKPGWLKIGKDRRSIIRGEGSGLANDIPKNMGELGAVVMAVFFKGLRLREIFPPFKSI